METRSTDTNLKRRGRRKEISLRRCPSRIINTEHHRGETFVSVTTRMHSCCICTHVFILCNLLSFYMSYIIGFFYTSIQLPFVGFNKVYLILSHPTLHTGTDFERWDASINNLVKLRRVAFLFVYSVLFFTV